MAIETKKTTCMFCSMGCGLLVSTERGNPVEIEYDFDNPINKGSLCPRGNYMFELLSHRSRLEIPMIKKDELLSEVSWDEALTHIAHKLHDIKRKYGGDSIAIIMEPNSLNEEVLLGHCLAKEVLKTKNFGIAFPEEDRSMLLADDEFCIKGEKNGNLEDIRKSDTLLIIGDILTKTPCLSKEVNKVKYGAKENKVIVIDSKKSHTSWFGSLHLLVSPGEEAMLVAGIIKALLDLKGKKAKASSLGRRFKDIDLKSVSSRTGVSIEDILSAARDFDAAKKATIILCSNFGKILDAGLVVKLAKILCSASKGDKRLINFYTGGNSLGTYLTLNAFSGSKVFPNFLEILEDVKKGKIKALITFGVDISRAVSSDDFGQIKGKIKFSVTSQVFETAGVRAADVVLPAASYAEKKGSIVSSGGVLQDISPVLPPFSGSKLYFDILSSLIEKFEKKSLDVESATQEVKNKLKKTKKKLKGNIAQVFRALKEMKRLRGESEKPFIFVPDDDIVHYFDRSITEKCFWAKENCKEPYLEIAPSDSHSLGIVDGQKLKVSSRREEAYLKVKVTERVPSGVISSPHHFAEVRKLFDIRLDSKTHIAFIKPENVSIEKG